LVQALVRNWIWHFVGHEKNYIIHVQGMSLKGMKIALLPSRIAHPPYKLTKIFLA